MYLNWFCKRGLALFSADRGSHGYHADSVRPSSTRNNTITRAVVHNHQLVTCGAGGTITRGEEEKRDQQ
jgi:hypothetical protein